MKQEVETVGYNVISDNTPIKYIYTYIQYLLVQIQIDFRV